MRKRKTAGMPPVHRMVYDVLAGADRPISAYEVLDRLRPAGVTAPPTVYRALNRLIDEGLAHRLESLNAFVSCARLAQGEPHRERAAFAICETCGGAEEFAGADAFAALHRWADEHRFRIHRAVIEVSGTCAGCRAAAGEDAPAAAP
jgi:Fur family zinc uptake transcriptional regulator